MSEQQLENIWARTAIASLQALLSRDKLELSTKTAVEMAELAASMGDIIAHEYDQRFSQLAQIMKGIPRCAKCGKETGQDCVFAEGARFCNEKCLQEFRDA